MIINLTNALHNSVILRTVSLFIAWLLVFEMGRLVEYTDHASVWFPAAGLTFASMFVLGKRAFIPLMAAAIVITVWQGHIYKSSLTTTELTWAGFLFGLAHILPYWSGAKLLEYLSKRVNHTTTQLIVGFLVISAIITFFATLLVIFSLVITNQIPLNEVKQTLLPFWTGDFAGVVVLAPLFSGLLIHFFPHPNVSLKKFTTEKLGSYKKLAYKISINTILIFITIFLAYLFDSRESTFAVFFLAVTHMWIACTESPKFNVISLAISSLMIILLVHYLDLMDYVMVYQFAISVIAANALFGIAVPQLQAHNKTLQQMVFTDSLTQVSSRHYMEQRAKLEIAQSLEKKSPLSLVVFDLDKFKQINDQLGHTAGDMILKKVCNATKSLLRKNDVIARFGGDEFIILLPGLNRNKVQPIIERIQRAIEKIEHKNQNITASFGITSLNPNEDFSTLFHRADQALYQSKEKGGNQISTVSKV